MASSAIHDALVTYLVGDSGDVRTTVNAEQTGLLPSGSVYLHTGQYLRNTYSTTCEVKPVGEPTQATTGIGLEEITHHFDLIVTTTRKASSDGTALTDKAEDACRALLRRYHLASNLSISPSNATFRRALAKRTELVRSNESGDTARGVVRVSFTFTEALVANT